MEKEQKIHLKDLTYYKTGGRCRRFYAPSTKEELIEAVRQIKKHREPLIVIGGGSNTLVSDEYWPGAALSFHKFSKLERQSQRLICGAGVENTAIAQFALSHALAGCGWMNRLPGQIGGTVRMNARCYGGEISQICKVVRCVNRDGEEVVYDEPQKVFHGYKDTHFMTSGELIYEVELFLTPGDKDQIKQKMDHCESDRLSKDQFVYPSCGCVFKNDYTVGVPSGLLLEKAGLKGMTYGGAQVSDKHANFVYNKGAHSTDVLELSLKMREAVWQRFGVWLEYEMEILGRIPDHLKEKISQKKSHQINKLELEELKQAFQKRSQL